MTKFLLPFLAFVLTSGAWAQSVEGLTLEELQKDATGTGSPEVKAELAKRLLKERDYYSGQIYDLARDASQSGKPEGKFLLGHCYSQGVGVPRDDRRAFGYYMEAAKAGHAGAINSIGYSYLSGLGVGISHSKAFEFFMRAASMGDRNAKFNLGFLYEYGIGVEKNKKQAIQWYIQAAEEGSREAPVRLKGLGYSYQPSQRKGLFKTGEPSVRKLPPDFVAETGPVLARQSQGSAVNPQILTKEVLQEHETLGSGTFLAYFSLVLLILALGGLGWGVWVLTQKGFFDLTGFFEEVLKKVEKSPEHNEAKTGFYPGKGPRVRKPLKLIFCCVECGQKLYIPNCSSRKIVECPSCKTQFNAWVDFEGIVRLENREENNQRKTHISFGEEQRLVSPYAILNLPEGAPEKAIKDAFKAMMKEYHPDKVANMGKELKDLAALKTRQINDAYAVLMKRRKIDEP